MVSRTCSGTTAVERHVCADVIVHPFVIGAAVRVGSVTFCVTTGGVVDVTQGRAARGDELETQSKPECIVTEI